MEAVFIYLLKSNGLIALFYLSYHFLVRKETFFNSNRWFLLSGIATSLLLPLYFLQKIVFIESPKIVLQQLAKPTPQTISIVPNTAMVEPFDWTPFIWIGYGIITSVLLLKIVLNLISLYKMLLKQQIIKKEHFKMVSLNDNIAPFSFFNYIVYNANLYSEEELESILLHEKVHSKEMHSIDVLVVQTVCAFFWFNPFIWLYKKAITQNLEYIADQKAIKQLSDKRSYQHALLKVVSNQNCLPITNNFYQSLIKKRIIMLNKNQSHKGSYVKYTLIFPALVAFVLLFQVKTIAKEKETADKSHAKPTIEFAKNTQTISENLESGTTETDGNYVFDKTETDENLKEDAADIERTHNIKFVISNVKRNANGEIIAIRMAFDDNKGNTGKTEQFRDIPIRPIFLKISHKEGKNTIGFYDNPDMVVKPVDPINENKIVTIESIKDDALIYVDNERYGKEDLNELDPKGLEKIEALTDAESLKKYGAQAKGVVYVITTNWPAREQNIALQQQYSPSVFTLANGDEVVVFDKNNVKLVGYPPVAFTDNSPIMIVDGVPQKNPRLSLERLPLKKIKTIKVVDQNDKEVKGTPIQKIIINTK